MAVLQRVVTEKSRQMEFFTERELGMQIGRSRRDWAIYLLKELIDNALDACELTDGPHQVTVVIGENELRVSDTGPGLPTAIIERSLNYDTRTSTNVGYVSPTRGQLGNALKCAWAAPFVATAKHDPFTKPQVVVVSCGKQHTITVEIDELHETPEISLDVEEIEEGTVGTSIILHWQDIADELFDCGVDPMIRSFSAVNPHVRFVLDRREVVVEEDDESNFIEIEPVDPAWTHWMPNTPTSPHWYDSGAFKSVISSYVRDNPDVTVREFVSTFSGLTGTGKQRSVLDALGLSRAPLSSLVTSGNSYDYETADNLLAAMKDQSRPINPKRMGLIGKGVLTAWISSVAGEETDVAYRSISVEHEGVPYVFEIAWGAHGGHGRMVVNAINWSFFSSSLDSCSEFSEMRSRYRVEQYDPLIIVVHVICPRLNLTSRGKDSFTLPREVGEQVEKMGGVFEKWRKAKMEEDRRKRDALKKLQESYAPTDEMSIKQCCYKHMWDGIQEATGNLSLPATARQVMYAVRRRVMNEIGKFYKDSASFTQRVLIDWLEENPDRDDDCDIVFDARGNIIEPHTGKTVPLGTIGVREYIRRWWGGGASSAGRADVEKAPDRLRTVGPENRFRVALFVEKEGFNEILTASGILEKYSIALMSTKGQSSTASRRLVDELSKAGVTIFVLHDFDKVGIEIFNKLANSSRRYQYDEKPNVVDMGLRLVDAEDMGLESEPVTYASIVNDPRRALIESGASKEEAKFLIRPESYGYYGKTRWVGDRVELNAMSSRQLIDFIERKLDENGIGPFVPDEKVAKRHYEGMVRSRVLQMRIEDIVSKMREDAFDVDVPEDLIDVIAGTDDGTPWDQVVADIAIGAAREIYQAIEDEGEDGE